MRSNLFQSFINSISSLTSEQRDILNNTLQSPKIQNSDTVETTNSDSVSSELTPNKAHSIPDLEMTVLSCFEKHPQCPKCKGHEIHRWGVRNGRQRYRCKTCVVTFNAFTDTPLRRLRQPRKWNKYLTGMTYSMTLRASAIEYDINLKTAFRWRHCFLEVINDDQAKELCGITELDETFFRESFKGQRDGMPRPTRKRGNDPHKARKVPVMVARDRNRHTVDGILNNESADELCRHLNGRISIEATGYCLCRCTPCARKARREARI